MDDAGAWSQASVVTTAIYGFCLVLYAGLTGLILIQARRSKAGLMLAIASAMTAVWALAGAGWAVPPLTLSCVAAARDLAWYCFLIYLYRLAAPESTGLQWAFAAVGLLTAMGVAASWVFGVSTEFAWLTVLPTAMIIVAISQILLLENLYRNAKEQLRWHMGLLCIALGALAAYELLMGADAMLFHLTSPVLNDGRVVVSILIAPLLAVAAARNRDWRIDIHLSRTAAFHSATFMVSGIFLLAMASTGELIRHIGIPLGARWSSVAEISLLFAGLLTVAVLLTSASARGAVRGVVIDHFFTHRFDYRKEWLRCIATLSRQGRDAGGPLALPDGTFPDGTFEVRAIRAVAQAVDSPGGVLLLREPDGLAWRWAGSLCLPPLAHPLLPDHPAWTLLNGATDAFVLSDEVACHPPLDELGQIWLAVPLRFGEVGSGRLVGCVLTTPPRASFRLDEEVVGLLRVLGQGVATYLAEQQATQTLAETKDLREFGQRFAFVAHDIKNVSSQLSMLLSNADLHLANPAFQADMLTTIRASVNRIGSLIQRLEPDRVPAGSSVALWSHLDTVAKAVGRAHGTEIRIERDDVVKPVAMGADELGTVVTHLLTNALQGSRQVGAVTPVRLCVHPAGDRVAIDVIDAGPGMSPQFVRDELFRPFRTSKPGGSGIGAFQVRELVRAAGGELVVFSRPSEGTVMRALLPTKRSADGVPCPSVAA